MTVPCDRTAVALGAHGITAGLSERDEVAVPRLPVLDRQDLAERHLRLHGLRGLDELQPVANAVDVHVHADRRKVEADGNSEVRGLASDPRQFAELLHRVRQHAAELLVKDVRKGLQVPRLVMVEADGEDELFDLSDGEAAEVARGEAERIPLLRCGEKALHRAGGAGVLGAGGEDGADEHAEGVVGLRLDEFDDGRRMRLEFLFERLVDGGDVLKCHGNILSQIMV